MPILKNKFLLTLLITSIIVFIIQQFLRIQYIGNFPGKLLFTQIDISGSTTYTSLHLRDFGADETILISRDVSQGLMSPDGSHIIYERYDKANTEISIESILKESENPSSSHIAKTNVYLYPLSYKTERFITKNASIVKWLTPSRFIYRVFPLNKQKTYYVEMNIHGKITDTFSGSRNFSQQDMLRSPNRNYRIVKTDFGFNLSSQDITEPALNW